MRFTAASYNIHRCIGQDVRHDPERVARVISEIDADIIGLQEVESRFGEAPDMHQLNFLAEETGFTAVAGTTILRPDSHYGNALLTCHPVLDVRSIDASVPGHEPRGILDVDLDVHGARVRALITHFGLRSGERRNQARRLLEAVAHNGDTPLIVLSDFNEWFPWRRPLRWMHACLGKPPAPNTFPAFYPLMALDRIWVTPIDRLVSLSVHYSPLARVASDHLPLKVTIELNRADGHTP